MKKIYWILFLAVFLMTGCVKKEVRGRRENVTYAVCKKSVLPRELMNLIDQEKEEVFHFTYSTRDFTYYVIGYGRQPGKGYKIRVREFSMDQDHIYIDTTLIGVTKEHQKRGTSFPYLVLKSQYYEKDAIFR
ncbi:MULTISPECIES: protease complex subunit PrcB family protein [Anaerostipes]|uniref:protease complex subunit PrcB family protein n=1 Tax=Anaerostipes TaxID=207244 RepID=UPI00095306D0|nr:MULTISPECIES: protease complex subunit PrcB family protein [Anaerostipes]MCI5623454.1 protease complex subunit PrcB family protein [Anaerostipes sp.]MDY2725221.1 protease complex subunit PrcB family protein [Anaerostipes faecalis]OLR59333.1 hypothetical protein BHF70_06680 [Anaerostipes sp. 494a]